jgi:hypothetical protein
MKAHHDDLVHHLKALCVKAGGPISLPALLRLALPKVQFLLGNGVPWNWLGARILAVHRDPEAEISPDLANLDTETVRTLVAEFSRQKRRRAQPKLAAEASSASEQSSEACAQQTKPGSDDRVPRPNPSPRARIHAAAELNSSIGQLVS